MGDMSTDIRALPKPIKGRGLTNPGIILLQFLLILLFETFDYSNHKVGVITGIAIVISVAGGFYLGRPGTSFATVVNPPIAFFISTFIVLTTVGGTGLHITKFGVAFVSGFGAGAPYLGVSTVAGWAWHLWLSHTVKSGTTATSSKVEPETQTEVTDPLL